MGGSPVGTLWMIRAAFFICIAFVNTPANCQIREYNPDEEVDIDPIETPYVWLTVFDWLPRFRAFTEPAKYFGSLIAGQAEFPWVVDVRSEELDFEGWSIGNLITGYWVLTACSVIRDWSFVEECGGISGKNTYSVYFCTNYINEDYLKYNAENVEEYHLTMGYDSHGKRLIQRIKKHPKCDTMKRIFNFALLKVNILIPLYVPVIGYMPLYGNPGSDFQDIKFKDSVYEKLYHMDGKLARYKKLVCYIASFGRPYNNVMAPQSLDYKVKYRAYFAEYDYCINDNYKLHLRLCYNNGNEPRNFSDKRTINDTCVEALKKFGDSNAYISISYPKFNRQFMCFRTYAKHGAVCDVDRGAPLYTHKASSFDDPEPPNPQDHTKDTNLDEWKKPQRNSEYIGLMFAGRSEFKWIIDIRIQNKDQELWSIGNLISSQHVLTTCKAITNFETLANDKSQVEIHYCTLWLGEEFKHFDLNRKVVFDIKSKENAGDLRHAAEFLKYPSCSKSTLDYDAGLVVVSKRIPIYTPFIGYMPVARDKNDNILISIDLSNMKSERRVCHIASYGRNFIDRQNHLVVDNKVKLRVYYEDWEKCKDNFPMICPNDEACQKVTTKENTMCFTTRAIVGSICDHDRGAPLVCDGQVYGLVIRGAAYDYCNTVWHLPILVLKISHLTDFHKYIEKSPDESSRSLKPERGNNKTSERTSAANLNFSFNIFLIPFTFFPVFIQRIFEPFD